MKKITSYTLLCLLLLTIGCNNKEKPIDAIWYEVYFVPEDEVGTYFPDDSHVLTFYEDSTIKVSAGKNRTIANVAVTSLEIIPSDSMRISYQWGATINSYYSFTNGDTLIIYGFSTNDNAIPFPDNIDTSYFLKTGYETYTD